MENVINRMKWAARRLIALALFVAGMGIGAAWGATIIRHQAIGLEYARYHPKTAAFEWIEMADDLPIGIVLPPRKP